MAKRQHFPHRPTLIAQLNDAELRIIHEVCRYSKVPFSAWHCSEPLVRFWETLAWGRIAFELQDVRDYAAKPAQIAAAIQLQLSPDTFQSRQSAWPRKAREVASIMDVLDGVIGR